MRAYKWGFMRERIAIVAFGTVCMAAGAAKAKDSNADRLCSERPGLTTSACITAPGRLQTETAIGDWTLDRRDGERVDTILIGDTLIRYGLGGKTELRLGWTPFGYERERDANGSVQHARRVGDATLGVKTSIIERKANSAASRSSASR